MIWTPHLWIPKRELLRPKRFLPGMFPGGALTPGNPLFTFVTHTTASNSETITGSASILAGDLLVMSDYATSDGAPTKVVPSGFTETQSAVIGSARHVLSHKIAAGSEASASITGMTGVGGNAKILAVFRLRGGISSATPSSGGAEGTDGNPASQNVGASAGDVPLVVLGAYGSSGAIDPRAFNPAKDDEKTATGTSVTTWLAYKIYNESPADTAIDMDDEGDGNTLLTRMIEVS